MNERQHPTEAIPLTAIALGMIDRLREGEPLDADTKAALRRTIGELVDTIDRLRADRATAVADREKAIETEMVLAQKVEHCERTRRLLAEMLRNALDELLNEDRNPG